MNRKRATGEKRRRTTWNGWRIVAGGALCLIVGSSLLSYSTGPTWFAVLLLAAGVGLVIFGRRH